MRLGAAITLLLGGSVCAQAALVSLQADADLSSPAVDGVISLDEYGAGNQFSYAGGGSGFGGELGSATLYMKSDVTNLYIAFANIRTNNNGNQYILYLHTRGGGFQTSNGEMTDFADQGRRNASVLSTSGVESVTFEESGISNKPDFALCFNNRATNGFNAPFELRGAGFSHVVLPRTVAGFGTTTIEFRIPRGALGLAVSGSVDFAAFEISDTAFLSNEGIPDPGVAGNIGFGVGTTNIFRDFHRFTLTSLAPGNGLTARVANTTLKMPAILPADGTNSYTTTNAFPPVSFNMPVSLATPPGETNRLFVVEQTGRILVITNLANPSASVFMDIQSRCALGGAGEGGLLGLAFHPDYASNRQFYVYYTASVNGNNMTNRLCRYMTQAGNPNQADTNSELRLLDQRDDASNHNGGEVQFGPDGYLYLSLGDEGGFNDNQNNSQTITKDFFSGIIRIDVDKKPGSLAPNFNAAVVAPTNYAVPPDNPFVGATTFNGTNFAATAVRTEFWAIGLRNPFRFSFDEVTGELYAGDVGQDAREEVDYIVKGGNYGWAYREGMISGPKATTNAVTAFRAPMCDYERGGGLTNGYVITGGRVYRGDRFPDLYGKYIFCDYGSGNMWHLTPDTTNPVHFTYLLTDNNISAFGRDPRNNDLLMCDLISGQIKRLERNVATNALPATLADAGVFADLVTLAPFPGIQSYELNVPFWSDNAIKSRWFSVPGTNATITFDATQPWTAPTGTIWIKHFDLLLTSGVPSSARRIETRLLVKNGSPEGGYGVTYRWGTSLTNAQLVGSGGLDEPILINDGGTIRTQIWRYPGRAQCLTCHTPGAGFSLGFNTAQLNCDHAYGAIVTNQLRALNAAGYFHTNVSGFNLLRRLAAATNTAYSLEYRVRSYLQSNCRQCHYPGGPATPATWDARESTALSLANLINGALVNDFGSTNNRVIVPGILTNSVLHTRIGFRGAGQMPPLGSNLVDTQNVALVAAWITSGLAGYESFAQWQVHHFGGTNNPAAARDADPDGDGSANALEYLTGTNPTNLVADGWAFDLEISNGLARVEYPRIANRGFDVQVTTNLIDGSWASLDEPANAPFFSIATQPATVADSTGTNRADSFYRVNVYEP